MILPGATVGVVGGGQLGRMFTLRARTMGYKVVVLDPDSSSPAGAVADRHIRAAYDDARALAELSATCAAITTEFENVPATTLETLGRSAIVRPPVAAVAITQDRIAEKTFLREHGFATAPYRSIEDRRDIREAIRALPSPAILKTNRLGYDGKGQAVVTNEAEAAEAFDRFGRVACILENAAGAASVSCRSSSPAAQAAKWPHFPWPRTGMSQVFWTHRSCRRAYRRRSPHEHGRPLRRWQKLSTMWECWL